MKHRLLIAVVLAIGLSTTARAQSARLWQRGTNSIVTVPCRALPADSPAGCLDLEARVGSRRIRLGEGYLAARPLWRARRRAAWPDVIVLGENGGSGEGGSLIAVRFAAQMQVSRVDGERLAEVIVRSHPSQPPVIDLPFNIEFFNGAPHAGVALIPLPLRITDGDWTLDLPALSDRRIPEREANMRHELADWAQASMPTDRLYPPMTVTSSTTATVETLAGLMLSGHDAQARRLLHRTWPRDPRRAAQLGGETDFWDGLCAAIVTHPYWARFHLSRLPDARALMAGAARDRQRNGGREVP